MADLMKDTYTFNKLMKDYGNFMVPVARIEINGTDIISSVKLKVSNIDVSLGIDVASTVSFTVNDIFDLKSRTVNSKAKSFLKLGNIVQVRLGYGSKVKSVFYGYIVDMTTEFTESPSIHVTAIDIISLLMKRKRENYTYQVKNYSDVIKQMLSEYPKCYRKIKVDKTDDSLSIPIQSGSDFDYIKKVICLLTNKQFIVFDGNLYLRDFDEVSKPIMELKWGESFLSFTERKRMVNTKFTVIGIEEGTKKEISASKAAMSDSIAALFKSKPMESVINDPKIKDVEHAKAKAAFLAEQQLLKSKSGNGKTIGLPEIVPGRYIKISNIGSSNTYYIKSVRHSISDGGFLTNFELGN